MPQVNSMDECIVTVTIPTAEYRDLVMAKNSLDILLNSVGKYHTVDSGVLQSVAKTAGFKLPVEE